MMALLSQKLFPHKLGRGGRPLRIAYGRVFQEANAFSPLPTTRADFEAMHCLDGAELHRATRLMGSEIAGFLPHAELTGAVQAARIAGDADMVPLWSTLAVSGGPVTAEAFAWLVDETLRRLQDAGRVDGVYLALHGSMQVDGLGRSPEGELLARVREAIGDAKLAVSYDLHGNLCSSMIEPADVVVAYQTNPHRDLFGTGFRANNLLIRTLREQCRPVHAWRKLPMVLGGGMSIDFLAPMRSVFRAMKSMERREGVLSANLFMVHPYNSAEDLGWATLVSTDGDQALAESVAEELADLAWAKRRVPLPEMLSPSDAFDRVRNSLWRRIGAVSLVDVDDIVGTGAPGGNTHLLAELVNNDRGLTSLVPLHDPRAIDALWSHAEGHDASVLLRGSPGYDTQPRLSLDVKVARKHRGEFGRMVRLDFTGERGGSVHVVVTERPPFSVTPRFWRELGLEPRRADVVIQKALFHYRMFYVGCSFRHLAVVSDGASSLKRVRERTYAVPTYPGDDPANWRDYDPILRQGASPDADGDSHGSVRKSGNGILPHASRLR